MVGLHPLPPESLSSLAASRHRPHMVAGHRGAVLLSLGAASLDFCARRGCWPLLLVGALIASPLFRRTHFAWITPTHTLTHIDGIAMGSLLALGLYTLPLSRRVWLSIGLAAMPSGFLAAATIAGGTAFLDTALTSVFAGHALRHRFHRIAQSDERNLRRGPLAFYGRISYGLYMTHIMVFIYFGWFDARMDQYGIPGNLAVVAFRLAACTAAATSALVRFRDTDSETQAPLLKSFRRCSSHPTKREQFQSSP